MSRFQYQIIEHVDCSGAGTPRHYDVIAFSPEQVLTALEYLSTTKHPDNRHYDKMWGLNTITLVKDAEQFLVRSYAEAVEIWEEG
jgi:hypothetical protein